MRMDIHISQLLIPFDHVVLYINNNNIGRTQSMFDL